MSMYSRLWDLSGPDPNPDAPEKTGFARLKEIMSMEALNILKLNLIFLLFSLPIITIPPAYYAMNQVMRRMMLDLHVNCFQHFTEAFKKYWKRGYAAFGLTAGVAAVAAVGAWFYITRAGENLLLFLPFLFCSTVLLVALLSTTCLYGFLSTGMPVKEALRLSIVVGVGRPLRPLLSGLCSWGLIIFGILMFPLSLVYMLFLGFSLPCFLGNFLIRLVIKKYGGEQALTA